MRLDLPVGIPSPLETRLFAGGQLLSVQSTRLRSDSPAAFLIELLLCIGPTTVLIRLGLLTAGVKTYFFTLFALLLWHLITVNFSRYFAIIISTIPFLMPLRKLFLFNTLLATIVIGLMGWVVVSPKVFGRLKRQKNLLWLVTLSILYWWASFVATESYSANLRLLDLAGVVVVIYLLGREKAILSLTMTGLAISVMLVAIALAPYGERLGWATVGDTRIGNPIHMGLESGLIFILTIAEDGQRLYTRSQRWCRILLCLSSLVCLLFSTSRGSWLTVIACLLVLSIAAPKERSKALVGVVLIAAITMILVASGHGEAISKYFEKASSSDRTLSQKTTLRSDQWIAVGRLLNDSPLLGYGVGQGLAANSEYSGQQFVMHSLYLQIAAETGLVGLSLLFLLLFRVVHHARNHLRVASQVVPLLGIIGFMVIGLSVSGFDPISGLYLGLAMLAIPPARLHLPQAGRALRQPPRNLAAHSICEQPYVAES